MPKRNVLFIVPALLRAGAESQLVALVNGLPSDLFERHIFSYREGDDLVDDVEQSDVAVHQTLGRRKLDIGVFRSIARLIDENEVDVVHCTLMNALLFGLAGRFFARRKPSVICVIHTTKNTDFKTEFADSVLHRHLLKRCAQIWFVSARQAKLWQTRMPFITGRECVIHNGVDPEAFDPDNFVSDARELRNRLRVQADELLVCCVAGFRPVKLHHILIRAFGKVLGSGIRGKLLLAGEGSEEPKLRELVAELGLQESVLFLGALSDVRPLLAAADCKVLPSAAETFSMAMLEAMAMGVPVISTEVGGAGEVIDDGVSGVLIPAGDIAALVESLTMILTESGVRASMGSAARAAIEAGFTKEFMLQKSANFLQQLPDAN